MTDKPITFSAPMVRALLAGRKTQTRRALRAYKYDPDLRAGMPDYRSPPVNLWQVSATGPFFRPRYEVGDRIYVREHWRVSNRWDATSPRDLPPRTMTVSFEAGGSIANQDSTDDWRPSDWPVSPAVLPWMGRFRQAMHMPRWASRLTLTVTDIRVHRLQEISEEDAMSEGVALERIPDQCPPQTPWHVPGTPFIGATPRLAFFDLWASLHGQGSVALNPWVAAYTFAVQRGNIDRL